MNNKFIIGDKVRCIEGNEKGSGWQLGYEFVVTSISNSGTDNPVYWKGYRDAGVYQDSLELARPKNLWKGGKR